MNIKSVLLTVLSIVLCSCASEPVHVTNVTLDSKALTIEVGASQLLTATVSPFNAENAVIVWSSDNASVAKVANGLVTALAPGTARITAQADDGGISDACLVTVPIPFVFVSDVSLDPSSLEMNEGDREQLHAVVLPDNADDPSLKWSSSAPDVAQVTSDGVLFALTPGEATITVTTVDGGKNATCSVIVKDKVTGLTLEPEQMDILIGQESDIVAHLEPDNANVNIVWKSTEPNIVSVDNHGHILGVSAGDATICAATDYKGKIAFCGIHVRNKIESFKVTADYSEVNIGKTLPLKVSFTPSNLPDTKIEWHSSNDSVATVDDDGLVTAKAKGTTIISATIINGPDIKTDKLEIKVIQPVTSIKVSPATLELEVDGEVDIEKSLSATIDPSDADDKTYSYKVSPASGSIISCQNGKIKGLKAGEAELYLIPNNPESDDIKATCKIIVKAKVESISLLPSLEIVEGGTYQLTVSITPKEASGMPVEWTSTNPTVASVASDGLVTANKVGTTRINASCGGKSATCEVTVTPKIVNVTGVTLDHATVSLEAGSTISLKATIQPDNASNKTLKWSSSNEAVARVDNIGNVTAVAVGTAVITVTTEDGNKSAECSITVTAPPVMVTSITLPQTSATIAFGQKLDLSAVTVLPADASNTTLVWTSSDDSIASVSNEGIVTAGTKAGTVTIKATNIPSQVSATCEVTVKSQIVLVTSVSISPSRLTMYVNETAKVTASVLPTNADNKNIKWSVSQGSTVTVDQNGNVTALREGSSRLIAKSEDGGASDWITVTVTKNAVESISLKETELTLKTGETYDLQYELKAKDPSKQPSNQNVSWKSSNPSIASVDTSGRITAKSKGTVSITVQSTENTNIKATCTVTILASGSGSGGSEGFDFEDWNF
mgnify:CR=1 FL=1